MSEIPSKHERYIGKAETERKGGEREMFKEVSIPVSIFKEDSTFIAYSQPLDLMTQGKTFDEVKTRFEMLVPTFFQELEEKGTLLEVLQELGWEKAKMCWKPPVKVGEFLSEVKVPCPA